MILDIQNAPAIIMRTPEIDIANPSGVVTSSDTYSGRTRIM
jgi:hypothetical protein